MVPLVVLTVGAVLVLYGLWATIRVQTYSMGTFSVRHFIGLQREREGTGGPAGGPRSTPGPAPR